MPGDMKDIHWEASPPDADMRSAGGVAQNGFFQLEQGAIEAHPDRIEQESADPDKMNST
jgi:hypothetical protein